MKKYMSPELETMTFGVEQAIAIDLSDWMNDAEFGW